MPSARVRRSNSRSNSNVASLPASPRELAHWPTSAARILCGGGRQFFPGGGLGGT